MHINSKSLKKDHGRNIDAFEVLFQRYYKVMCAYAYFIVREEEEAKDMVQGLFIELWEKGRLDKLEGDVKNYLYKAIHNKCLNYVRNREVKLRKHLNYHDCQKYDAAVEQEDDMRSLEKVYNALEANLNELPTQRREAISLVYLQDKKYREVADTMGISINSLKTHLKIGLKNLRKKVEKLKKN
ncbi:RNA polymerase sigma-70 factor [Olivibacter sp. SDN3]|uniref:RNA polymerase sigma factor n=1 Tax=Olivibacter sp. SDN3 TaxID=2764720 RepID=UPI001651979E|nr:RNA polymerase sigma-70 factor [Olivibacter sp. SDN3]QNL49283.1 RNA polymerase sigma-70 factor [Olivibacter sp. SDN3]